MLAGAAWLEAELADGSSPAPHARGRDGTGMGQAQLVPAQVGGSGC